MRIRRRGEIFFCRLFFAIVTFLAKKIWITSLNTKDNELPVAVESLDLIYSDLRKTEICCDAGNE